MTDPSAAELFPKRVRVGLRQVQSKKRAGARLLDCLSDAYDVYADAFYEAGEQLTDGLLTERIPALVHDVAVKFKWLPHPSFRHRGRGAVVAGFLPGIYNPARYEPIPEVELTEIFGGYKVRNGYAAAFVQIIEGRVLHWRPWQSRERWHPILRNRNLPATRHRRRPQGWQQ